MWLSYVSKDSDARYDGNKKASMSKEKRACLASACSSADAQATRSWDVMRSVCVRSEGDGNSSYTK
jgi:hypothetical protein